MINYAFTYIYSDQVPVCPKCGIRTQIIMDLLHIVSQTQIHLCLNSKCKYEFVMQYDKEFDDYDRNVIENYDNELETQIFA